MFFYRFGAGEDGFQRFQVIRAVCFWLFPTGYRARKRFQYADQSIRFVIPLRLNRYGVAV